MFVSSRCKRSDLDVLYDRLRQLEKDYSDLMLQQQQTENIISENNAALTQKSLEIRQLKTLVEDKNTELREQVERNSASSQEISFLNQKLAEVKEKRKIDKIKIKELEAEINRLRCENAELRSAKEVAEIRAQQYKAEIDRLQEQVNKHETEITTTKEIYKNQVIEEIKTLMRTGCRSSFENELSLPCMTALQEELNGILSEAKTPKEAARKFMENHPELNIIETDKVSLFKSALEVLKFKAGVGKYEEICKKMNAVGKPEDVRFQSYFLELLQNKNDGMGAKLQQRYLRNTQTSTFLCQNFIWRS